jgi:hypothetical protein
MRVYDRRVGFCGSHGGLYRKDGGESGGSRSASSFQPIGLHTIRRRVRSKLSDEARDLVKLVLLTHRPATRQSDSEPAARWRSDHPGILPFRRSP